MPIGETHLGWLLSSLPVTTGVTRRVVLFVFGAHAVSGGSGAAWPPLTDCIFLVSLWTPIHVSVINSAFNWIFMVINNITLWVFLLFGISFELWRFILGNLYWESNGKSGYPEYWSFFCCHIKRLLTFLGSGVNIFWWVSTFHVIWWHQRLVLSEKLWQESLPSRCWGITNFSLWTFLYLWTIAFDCWTRILFSMYNLRIASAYIIFWARLKCIATLKGAAANYLFFCFVDTQHYIGFVSVIAPYFSSLMKSQPYY